MKLTINWLHSLVFPLAIIPCGFQFITNVSRFKSSLWHISYVLCNPFKIYWMTYVGLWVANVTLVVFLINFNINFNIWDINELHDSSLVNHCSCWGVYQTATTRSVPTTHPKELIYKPSPTIKSNESTYNQFIEKQHYMKAQISFPDLPCLWPHKFFFQTQFNK